MRVSPNYFSYDSGSVPKIKGKSEYKRRRTTRMEGALLITTLLCLQVACSALRMHLKMSVDSQVRAPTTLDSMKKCLDANANGVRIFHPAFPLSLLTPISVGKAEKIMRVKEMTNTVDFDLEAIKSTSGLQFLPWKMFPELGVPETEGVIPSKSKILESYEKNEHLGQFVW